MHAHTHMLLPSHSVPSHSVGPTLTFTTLTFPTLTSTTLTSNTCGAVCYSLWYKYYTLLFSPKKNCKHCCSVKDYWIFWNKLNIWVHNVKLVFNGLLIKLYLVLKWSKFEVLAGNSWWWRWSKGQHTDIWLGLRGTSHTDIWLGLRGPMVSLQCVLCWSSISVKCLVTNASACAI